MRCIGPSPAPPPPVRLMPPAAACINTELTGAWLFANARLCTAYARSLDSPAAARAL